MRKSRNRRPPPTAVLWVAVTARAAEPAARILKYAHTSRSGHSIPPAHPKLGSCCGPHKLGFVDH